MKSGVFYAVRAEGLYAGQSLESRVDAGSNTATVALRVVGGDEKGSLEFDWHGTRTGEGQQQL
jgi:hypothetical protein